MTEYNIFIVIPVYNEDIDILRNTITKLLDSYSNYSIIVVDDGSEKNIRPHLKGFPVIFLRHKINLGQGAALQTASSYILNKKDNVEHCIVVHFDADGQHDQSSIKTLVEPIIKGDADIVLGSRFLGNTTQNTIPPLRLRLLKIARQVNNVLTGVHLSDAHNGLRAMNGQAIKKIKLTQNRFAHATEIITLIRKSGLKYIEVPVTIHYTDYSLHKGQRSTGAINILFELFIKKIIK
ncbi:MAG: glycosyltransferase family 2 protein [Chitinophagaceae bacterium]